MPIFPQVLINNTVIFPNEKSSLILEKEEAHKSVEKALQGDGQVLLMFKYGTKQSGIGVLVKIIQHWNLTTTIIGAIVEGQKRMRVINYSREGDIETLEAEDIPVEVTNPEEKTELEALSRSNLEQFKKIIQSEGLLPFMVIEDLQKEYIEPEKAADLIAANLKLDIKDKVFLLEEVSIKKRLEFLSKKLANELNIAKAEERIENEIEKEVDQAQKEYVLKERLRAIEKELGIFEEQKEHDDIEQKLVQAGLPEESRNRIFGELGRLKRMPPTSPEAPYIRSYLEWIADLPWNKRSEVNVDLGKARKVLDEDHYGLEKAKERVLEYLAVQKLTGGKGRGGILCFVGPPGTGKTSVGQSIAKAVGRNFVRISLGGIRDEAEIRGHRRTYVGALPGRIIQGMRTAGTKNPVFMMDEIDKIGADFRGDPASALLEVLDPAQNNSFSDHYIEVPFDLSEVFFITTANVLDPIPPALNDRMEVIEFPGYTDEEKFHIAEKYLIPRVLSSTGLNDERLKISDEAVMDIINHYTREAGVRDLERKVAEIARKVAKSIAEGNVNHFLRVGRTNLSDYLGPEEYTLTTRVNQDEVGVSTALAWTPVGGQIIFIESMQVPGKGNLTLTGQLGEQMQESARAALTYVRSKYRQLNIKPDFYYRSDIHVHVPEGAIPKDGPSAGTALATSIASILTNRKVKKDVAITGEITLSGKVLKVGGIKEKVLAAHRSGIKTIILPVGNRNNLIDIPKEVLGHLEFKFVKHMDEVLPLALN